MGVEDLLHEMQKPSLPEGVEGFGYLVPSIEQQPILGVQFNSCAFPQQDPKVHCGRWCLYDMMMINVNVAVLSCSPDVQGLR